MESAEIISPGKVSDILSGNDSNDVERNCKSNEPIPDGTDSVQEALQDFGKVSETVTSGEEGEVESIDFDVDYEKYEWYTDSENPVVLKGRLKSS